MRKTIKRLASVVARLFRFGAYLACYVAAYLAWIAVETAAEAEDMARLAAGNTRIILESLSDSRE